MPISHAILTDAMTSPAVYVGMTRGKDENRLHIIAGNLPEARAQFIDALARDRADRGLTDATQQAQEAVPGLVDDGPVKLVHTEIAAVIQRAGHAEASAARWQQASDALDELHARQRPEREQAAEANDAAKQQLGLVRVEVAEPLTAQARTALTEWQIDADSRVVEAEQQRATTADALHAVIEPNPWPSINVHARVFGEEAVRKNPSAYVNARSARHPADATRTVQQARAEAETLRALTPDEAVERIAQTRATEEARWETLHMLAEREHNSVSPARATIAQATKGRA